MPAPIRLITRTRAAKLNLSSIAGDAIGAALVRVVADRFKAEVARGLAEHAAYLAEHGSLAEAVRRMGEEEHG